MFKIKWYMGTVKNEDGEDIEVNQAAQDRCIKNFKKMVKSEKLIHIGTDDNDFQLYEIPGYMSPKAIEPMKVIERVQPIVGPAKYFQHAIA